jgi:hypothetical protein
VPPSRQLALETPDPGENESGGSRGPDEPDAKPDSGGLGSRVGLGSHLLPALGGPANRLRNPGAGRGRRAGAPQGSG